MDLGYVSVAKYLCTVAIFSCFLSSLNHDTFYSLATPITTMEIESKVVTPGDYLGEASASNIELGPGVYELNGKLYASLTGNYIATEEDGVVSAL